MVSVKRSDVVKLLKKVKSSINEKKVNLSDIEIDKRIKNLERAKAKLEDGIAIIRDAVVDTGIIGDRVEWYVIPHLESRINGEVNSVVGVIDEFEKLKDKERKE